MDLSPDERALLETMIERAFFYQRAGEIKKSQQNVELVRHYFGDNTADKLKKSLREDRRYVPQIRRA